MNAAATATTAAVRSARTIALVAVLGAAAALGLVFGAALNERSPNGETTNGYPPGWRGGAAIPVSRVAAQSFSLDALDAVRIARGDAAAPASGVDEIDYFKRHPQLTGPKPARIPANVE